MNKVICIPSILLAGFNCISAVLIDNFSDYGRQIICSDSKEVNHINEHSCLIVKGTEFPGSKRTIEKGWHFNKIEDPYFGIYCIKGEDSNTLGITYQLASDKYLNFEDIAQFEFSFPVEDSYSFSSYQVQIKLKNSNGEERITKNFRFSDDFYQVCKIEEYIDTENFREDEINKIAFVFKYIGSDKFNSSKPNSSKIFGIQKIGAYPNIYPTNLK